MKEWISHLFILILSFKSFFFGTFLSIIISFHFHHLLRVSFLLLLFLVSLHLSELFLSVLLLHIRVHFFSIIRLNTKFILVLSSIFSLHLIFVFFIKFIFKFDSLATNIYLIWLRNYLVTNDAWLAVQAAEILDITCELMNHDIIKLSNFIVSFWEVCLGLQ